MLTFTERQKYINSPSYRKVQKTDTGIMSVSASIISYNQKSISKLLPVSTKIVALFTI